ncbi:MAG: hypothetical protein ABSH38_04070 [Verrucomicrobiota bacterium]|jgi:hypothetical protein
MMKQILLMAGVVLGCGTGWSAPLQRADVAAGPAVVAHFDCDGLRATAIGKAILAQLDAPAVAGKLAAFQAIFSFDPRTQLHGLTFYSAGQTPQNGVLLFYADFESNRLITLAKAASDYHCITNGSRLIHSWIDEKKKAERGDKGLFYAAIQGNRVIFGQSESTVAGALDVLDGKAPSLAGGKTQPELGAAGAGTFLQGMVSKFDFASKDPNSAMLKMSKMVRFQVGEAKDQLRATVSFEANDADTATQISAIAQGLIALGKLQQGNPGALKLANSVSVRQDGVNVIATLTMPEADAVDLIKAGAAEKARDKSEETNSVPSP